MKTTSGRLWRHTNFLKLWSAETVSAFGDAVSDIALPLVAIITLGAGAREMGILRALDNTPILLFGLFIGVWVDRVRRRPLMIAAQLGRGILLVTIPVATVVGVLRIELLYFISFLGGMLSAIFTLATTTFLPALVPHEDLVEGNSKLSVSRSGTKIVGPGLAGLLVERITAPFTVALNVLSCLISGACLVFVRSAESVQIRNQQTQGIWHEISEGLRTIFLHPILLAMTIGTTIGSFGGAIHGTVFILYLNRELMINPTWFGIILASGGAASLLGAIVAKLGAQHYGPGPMLIGSTLLMSIGMGIVPLAAEVGRFTVPILIVAQAFQSIGLTVYGINQISLRQAITPSELLGRVNASRRVLVFGVIPFAAMIGGALGETIGLRFTLVVGGIVEFLAFVFHLTSPLRHVTDFRKVSKQKELP